MKRATTQDGSIPHQVPAFVLDNATGELLDYDTVNKQYVMPFLEYVRDKVKETIAADKDGIIKAITEEDKVKQPTGLAWKHGIRPDLTDGKKQKVLALSRVEKVIQHRIVSELQSFVNNPNPKKQEPTFEALKANLGSADQQISTVEYDDELNKAFLVWKCWSRELLFVFDLPDFADGYEISKMCLPSVRYDVKRNRVEYDFPFVENLDYSQNEYHHCYGAVDLGRVEPYRLAFKNRAGALIAEYRASGRCRALNAKRERILKDVKCINVKLGHYDALGVPEDNPKRERLVEEKRRLRAKARAEGEALARLLGWEVSRHCKRHEAAALGVEDLSWVNDAHGSSRWVHSKQESWIERECCRVGTAFLRVNAKNSSQTCCECGSKKVVHNEARRTIRCKKCRSVYDRDVSAARVLADRCVKAYCKFIDKLAVSRLRC